MSQGMMMPMQPPPAPPAKPITNSKAAIWQLVQMLSQLAQGFQKVVADDETVQANDDMKKQGEVVMTALHDMTDIVLKHTKM